MNNTTETPNQSSVVEKPSQESDTNGKRAEAERDSSRVGDGALSALSNLMPPPPPRGKLKPNV